MAAKVVWKGEHAKTTYRLVIDPGLAGLTPSITVEWLSADSLGAAVWLPVLLASEELEVLKTAVMAELQTDPGGGQ